MTYRHNHPHSVARIDSGALTDDELRARISELDLEAARLNDILANRFGERSAKINADHHRREAARFHRGNGLRLLAQPEPTPGVFTCCGLMSCAGCYDDEVA